MKPEQQRIAIAEACGWSEISDWKAAEINGLHPSGQWTEVIPNYTSDLNAMHEAEKVLTAEQRRSYVNCIFNLPVSECESNTFATAAQRAKAFLRAIGKWEVSHD
jgi:hypothetical protein